MTTIDLGDLTPRDIGRHVTIKTADTTITGPLNDYTIETDWITEATAAQHPDDWRQTPGRRTVSITIGPWTTGRLPLNTRVEVAERTNLT